MGSHDEHAQQLAAELAGVDEAVAYRLFTLSPRSLTGDDCLAVSLFAADLAQRFLWHKEPFSLALVDGPAPAPGARTQGAPTPAHLAGSTRFGDSLDDEWFVAYLLFAITQRFPDLVATVTDTDGDFLLIEAAECLPDWLDPTTSANRVFVHRGQLHIIPPSATPAPPHSPKSLDPPPLALETALRLIADPSVPTLASQPIQDAIRAKTSAYPAAIAANKHHARIIVPIRVAHLLVNRPQLVAQAVEAFVTRDPISMRPCQTMRAFPPSTNVTMRAELTRMMYAQMESQPFHAPPPFRMPPRSSADFHASELGMKLACGFEMLYQSKHLRQTSRTMSGEQTFDAYDFEADPEWRRLKARLTERGFFMEQVAGSQLYQMLERTAKQHHFDSKFKATASTAANAFDEMDHILKNVALVSVEDLPTGPDDSDAWMHLDPAHMDADLARRMSQMNPDAGGSSRQFRASDDDDDDDGGGGGGDESDLDPEEAKELEQLQSVFFGFQSFVNRESGLDGVEFDGTAGDGDDQDSDEEQGPEQDAGIRLDPDVFRRYMMQALQSPASANEPGSGAAQQEPRRESRPVPSRRPAWAAGAADSDDDENEEDADAAEQEDSKMRAYMDAMDRQLFATKLGGDFTRHGDEASTKNDVGSDRDEGHGEGGDDEEDDDEEDEEDDYKPVDLDVNLVKNMLESYSAQQGLSGPVSNIMMSMGMRLPRPDAGTKDRPTGTR
ncbi:SGT1 protein-domain-containing protein [Entophlyctis helioformis]|nr:SGT1 protein-domain-containing protein [Entophlyctis helioformis]